MLLGIVGKPSCGKSTFFKAATLAEVEIANYPFTTIKPNQGTGYVSVECVCKDFNKQCNPRFGFSLQGTRFVPVEMLDVAGLVPGAHTGKGMGNKFLDDLRQAHVLVHVIDVSGSVNEKGEPVESLSYDPANDVRFLEVELDMWYNQILSKGWDRFARQVKQEKKEIQKALAKQLSGLGVTEQMVLGGIKEFGLSKEEPQTWTADDLMHLSTFLRKKTKPIIIACNKIDVPGAAEKFSKLVNDFPDHMLVACSAESELALREAAKHDLIKYVPGNDKFEITDAGKLSDKQKKALEFIQKNVLDKYGSTGVQEVLDKAVFDLLKYIAVFPGGVGKLEDSDGNVLPDCFLMPAGTTALDFAYRLHTDFGKNFIKAVDVKKKLPVGKDHQLKHRDIIEIMSGK
ncbi:redox-regulated ATPase YchF [Candidatus Woesearchaeota archaeon]|nr:redox-regulated ATPase YchF [Candidatus Woesearchaeota archaeon]